MAKTKELLLNIGTKEIRAACLVGGRLWDLEIDRKKSRLISGNIYRGEVNNILQNIQSAFIDIEEKENGFIHISDILFNAREFEQRFDLDFEMGSKGDVKDEKSEEIDKLMKPNQTVLVQVVKEPIGSKGARLTSNISLAGRYLVLLPNSSHRGVSRKIEERSVRERLKKLVRSFDMPSDIGLICRTAGRFATTDMLIDEASDLYNTWLQVVKDFKEGKNPKLLWEESDILKRSVINAIDEHFDRILVDDQATFQKVKLMLDKYSTEHAIRLEQYRDKIPMFERFNVEREIEKSLRRKIWLPNGGYIYFEKTEAMHTVDVNSGRSNVSTTDVEESLVRINMEAAEEIGRQLRLRNVGGLVVCDFIDMRLKKNHRRVLEKLKDALKGDTAKTRVLGMSDFGLVEMTRQRTRTSLAQALFKECPYCNGRGVIKSHESVTIEIERALQKLVKLQEQFALKISVHPHVFEYMDEEDRRYIIELAEQINARLEWDVDDTLHLNDFYFTSTISNERLEV